MSLNSYLVTDAIRPLPGSGWTSKNANNIEDSVSKYKEKLNVSTGQKGYIDPSIFNLNDEFNKDKDKSDLINLKPKRSCVVEKPECVQYNYVVPEKYLKNGAKNAKIKNQILENELDELQAQHGELQQQHGELQQQHGELQLRYDNSQGESNALQEQHGRLTIAHNNLGTAHSALQRQHEQSLEELNALQHQHGQLTTDHTTLRQQYDQSQKERDELLEQQHELRFALSTLRQQHVDSPEERDALEQQQGDLQTRLEMVTSELEKSRIERTEQKKLLKTQQAEKNLIQAELEATKEILRDIETRSNMTLKESDDLILDLQTKLLDLQRKLILSEQSNQDIEALLNSYFDSQPGIPKLGGGTRHKRKPRKGTQRRRTTRRLRYKKFPRKCFSLRKREK
jgi:chromosome segregation ATPase